MIIYIITFILSLLFLKAGLNYKFGKKTRLIFTITGIIIPCLLAGLRDVSVGTDTSFYVKGLFELTHNNKMLIDYIKMSNLFYHIHDNLYLIITFIIAKLFDNFNILLFVYELLIIVPLYISLNLNKNDNKNVVLGMFIFYMFCYNMTFNILRQSISLSFCVLSISLLLNNKNKFLFLISLLIAFGFHSTSLVLLLPVFIYKVFSTKVLANDVKEIIKIFIILFSIIIIIFLPNIVNILYSLGIYQHGKLFVNTFLSSDFSFLDSFIYFVFIFFIIINKKYLKEKDNIKYHFYLYLSILAIIYLQIGSYITFGERISYYFLYPVLFNYISNLNSNNCKNKKINEFIMYSLLIIYWIVVFCVLKVHSTVPYVFVRW